MFDNFQIVISPNKSQPIYEQLRNQLADYIRSNKIEEGTQLPDIKTMGEASGVSLRTVERAYTMLIEEGFCFRRPKKGTFVGNLPFREKNETRRICALFHPDNPLHFEDDKVLAPLYSGIQAQAQKENIDLWILSEQSLPFYLNCSNLEVVGVLMLYWRDVAMVNRIVQAHRKLRFVLLNYLLDGFEDMSDNVYGVFNDDFAGGYEAADFLISRGHSRIRAFTFNIKDCNYRQRIEGFLQALGNNRFDTHGVVSQFDNRREPHEKELIGIGRTMMVQMLEEAPDTTAVFCVNDLMASGAAQVLEEKHLREQIEIVGYDNVLSYLGQQYGFSTIAVNFEQIGIRAMQVLAHPEGCYPKMLRIAPRLIPRNFRMLQAHGN